MNARDVLLAVRAHQGDVLREEINTLGADVLAATGDVHFARLTLLEDRPGPGDAVLLVAVVFDGPPEHLGEILSPLGRVWRYCHGYDPDPARFSAWIDEHALTPPYIEHCYANPVADIRRAVRLRRGLGDLAFDLRHERDPAALAARFAAFSEAHP